jgi:sarcosine oxidase subunit alpha
MSGRVQFAFEGRTIDAPEGQSIAAALYAAGVKTLSWSSKYRRPRGLRCMSGSCPNCALRVDGLQGVTACLTPVRGGERVERQKPVARMLPLDRLSRLAPAGFYYERFAHSPRAWRYAERGLAKLAGVAELAPASAGHVGGYRERSADVLVVGGGRRGMTAALDASAAGADVVLVERDIQLGGGLIGQKDPRHAIDARAQHLVANEVEVLLGTTYIGAFEEGVAGLVDKRGLTAVAAEEVIECHDNVDRELAFANGDRPGVLLAGGLRRLLVRDDVRPGTEGVVVGPREERASVLELLTGAGVRVAAEAEADQLVAAHGRREVNAVTIGDQEIKCDFVVLALGRCRPPLRGRP